MTKHSRVNLAKLGKYKLLKAYVGFKNRRKYKKSAGTEFKHLPNLEVLLLNRRINMVTIPSVITIISQTCLQDKKILISYYNIHAFNLSLQIPWFHEFQDSADLVCCDGTGILVALNYIGVNLPAEYRSPGTKLMHPLIKHCHENNLSIFLLGTIEETLQTALYNLRLEYPRLSIEGHHGYFDISDPQVNQAIIQKINAFQPNILVVGMGMPRQEDWIRHYRDQLEVNVILPCGAVIDRLAGLVSDCPKFLSHLGLEWLYRLSYEPKRLAVRYLVGNPAFGLQIALAKAFNHTVELNEMPSLEQEVILSETSHS